MQDPPKVEAALDTDNAVLAMRASFWSLEPLTKYLSEEISQGFRMTGLMSLGEKTDL